MVKLTNTKFHQEIPLNKEPKRTNLWLSGAARTLDNFYLDLLAFKKFDKPYALCQEECNKIIRSLLPKEKELITPALIHKLIVLEVSTKKLQISLRKRL